MFIEGYFKTKNNQSYLNSDIYIHSIIETIEEENPFIKNIFSKNSFKEVKTHLMEWINKKADLSLLSDISDIYDLYQEKYWKTIAFQRLSDYLKHEGEIIMTANNQKIISNPLFNLWQAIKFRNFIATKDFYLDFLYLFRQLNENIKINQVDKKQVEKWMDNHVSGLNTDIIELRKINKDRIIRILIKKIEEQKIRCGKYKFDANISYRDKYLKMLEWWNTRMFHLQFAVRDYELLNELLDYSLNIDTLKLLKEAKEKGIPLFVNPYYISLLLVNPPEKFKTADLAIRDYIFASQQLINEFGHIKAWEKEDMIEPGKPNAAGWILPNDFNIHRRYPEVVIFIPKTVARACGGLCVSCQRMYNFQKGNLNFDLNKLKAKKSWWEEMPRLLKYIEDDSQIRDILITGGDALMSSDDSLKRILDEIHEVALRKRNANKQRKEGEKFAELLRIRIGTRLLAYIPQRVGKELYKTLKEFKLKASKIGIKQFIIQVHFETALEITPEVQKALAFIYKAGWIVTNQLVFTPAASRRGHTVKLRKTLNENGILSYYTFSVKGFKENTHNFSPNARTSQEIIEEKSIGTVPESLFQKILNLPNKAENIIEEINNLKQKENLPFLSTDRNLINLPAVGKSLSYRTIGITNDGRRILEFDHDTNRNHSPIINKMGKIIIVESKSIAEYLRQQSNYGENIKELESIWGYSMAITEKRSSLFVYPNYPFKITKKMTNLKL